MLRPICLLLISIVVAFGNPTPTPGVPVIVKGTDRFEFTYRLTLPNIEESGRLWVPVATSDRLQQVELEAIPGKDRFKDIRDPAFNNRILFMELAPGDSGRTITLRYQVTRQEHSGHAASATEDPGLFLKPDALGPLVPRLAQIAREQTANAATDSDKAAALYRHTLDRIAYLGFRHLDASTYQVFDDLYLPRPDGEGTTQLDHVVVSPFGVFVIETKNYQGWIFGSEKQRSWTQSIYKKKHRFQNPLHQNNLHVRALAAHLGLKRNSFHSVVFFIGDCTFKTELPANVLNRGLRGYIENFQSPLLVPPEIARCTEALRELDRTTDRHSASRAHVAAIKGRRVS